MIVAVINPYAAGAGGPFVPPSISANYLQWVEARHETAYNDTDAATTGTDVSGAGNNWSQATAGNKPTFRTNRINGKPSYAFDGTDDFWELAADILSGETEAEVFIVVKLDAEPTTSGKDGLWKMDGDGTNACHYSFNSNGELYEAWGSTARKSTGVNPASDLAQWRLYNVSSKASEFKIRIDGTEVYTTATNTFSSMGATRNLGRSVGLFGNAYLKGEIAAIVVVDAVLGSTDRDAIEAVFANASVYNLTIA